MRNATESRGELEQPVMKLVWELQPCTAETVREKLDRPLKESTVRTVLRRLEDKRLVRHTVENRTFLYTACQPRQHAAASAVKKIADWFCGGSVEELLVGMVDSKVLNEKELQRLADKIARERSSKK
jgi:BlaI family penicillinase repressor